MHLTLLKNLEKANTTEQVDERPDYRQDEEEPVIDINGEDERGGSSSTIFSCEQCSYKSFIKNRLSQHIKAKHEEFLIPCENCKFKGNADQYLGLMKNNRGKENEENSTTQDKDKGKKSSNKNTKAKNDTVKIPCDLCQFVGKSASDYMKHIEEHNKPAISLSCDLCDFKTNNAERFKLHIETAHGMKVKKDVSTRNDRKNGFCVYWNRGYCNFGDAKCFFQHKNIPACRFQERCSKPECNFYHKPSLGKFPFLGRSSRAMPRPHQHHRRQGHQQGYQQGHQQDQQVPRQQGGNQRF